MLSQEFKDYLTDPFIYYEGHRASWSVCHDRRLDNNRFQVTLAVEPVTYSLNTKEILYPCLNIKYDGSDMDFLHCYEKAISEWKGWTYVKYLEEKFGLTEDDAYTFAYRISHISFRDICGGGIAKLWRLYWQLHPIKWSI